MPEVDPPGQLGRDAELLGQGSGMARWTLTSRACPSSSVTQPRLSSSAATGLTTRDPYRDPYYRDRPQDPWPVDSKWECYVHFPEHLLSKPSAVPGYGTAAGVPAATLYCEGALVQV